VFPQSVLQFVAKTEIQSHGSAPPNSGWHATLTWCIHVCNGSKAVLPALKCDFRFATVSGPRRLLRHVRKVPTGDIARLV
jgi:hypothetical protein